MAATQGPGLVAALLVGFSAAKALAAARQLPFAGVDHLHGHLAASFLEPAPFDPPFLALIASGGHTLLLDVRDHGPGPRVLGQTLDDAAGEAFDKGARLLGLGYPGGAALERLARDGDPQAFEFPTASRMPGLDFSFAGLKTALLYRSGTSATPRPSAYVLTWPRPTSGRSSRRCWSASRRALAQTGADRLAVGGGVAANGPLRDALGSLGVELDLPPRALCTDNAAMIAAAARYTRVHRFPDYLALEVYATGERSSGS